MNRKMWLLAAMVPAIGLSAASGLSQPEDRPQRPQRQGFDPAQFVERMMERDADGDGKLSKEELGPRGEQMLERLDSNEDGLLDRAELEASFANRTQPRVRGPEGTPGPAMSFEDGMSQAGRAMRRLRRSDFSENTREGDLMAVQMVQMGLLTAKQQLNTVEMSEAAREKFGDNTSRYHLAMRRDLVAAVREALDLEMAIASGNAEKAQTILARLLEQQDQSHDLFQHEEEEHEDEAVRPATRRLRPGGDGG